MPKAWQVLTERHYLLPVALRDRHRLLATPCTVILFDLVRAPQLFFSDPLQRARHQVKSFAPEPLQPQVVPLVDHHAAVTGST